MSNSDGLPDGPSDQNGDPLPPAAQIIAHMAKLNPVYDLLAIELLEARHGYSRFAMPVTQHLSNTFGNAHGGLIFAFADICFGFTANAARNIRGMSSSAEIHWLAPGLVGTRLIGETREIWHKGRNGLYDVYIRSQTLETDNGAQTLAGKSTDSSDTDHDPLIAIVHGRMRFIGGTVLTA